MTNRKKYAPKGKEPENYFLEQTKNTIRIKILKQSDLANYNQCKNETLCSDRGGFLKCYISHNKVGNLREV